MKSRLPALRQALVENPAYFKRVYLHTFDLIKPSGSRVLPLDTGKSLLRDFCARIRQRFLTARSP